MGEKSIASITIEDIKQHLRLSEILHHYNLKPDKNLRLQCPFHEDKTPSMQVYYKTHTCYCFSTNCSTHGKSIDVIDFIMHKEKITKHEAIEKAKSLITNTTAIKPVLTIQNQNLQIKSTANREDILKNMFIYFKNGLHSSKPAKDYIKQRGLDATKIEIGYNTSQFHHGQRRDQSFIDNCVWVGLLFPWGTNSRNPELQAYKPFAKYCICFALRNKTDQITGLYFRSTENNTDQKHYYLKESSGLYPSYPKAETKKLIIAESIIDAASLLQIESITKEYSIIAAYGTNRLNEEIKQAIIELKDLKEIIFAFDMDEAGNKAVEKYSKELKEKLPQVKFSKLELPCKDVNETLLAHNEEIFSHLLETRVVLLVDQPTEKESIFLSTEKEIQSPALSEVEGDEKKNERIDQEGIVKSIVIESIKEEKESLQSSTTLNFKPGTLSYGNPEQLHYNTDELLITLLGGISMTSLDRMRVTIHMRRNPHTYAQYSIRQNIDLYQDDIVEKFIRRSAEKLELSTSLISKAMAELTEELEQYRLNQVESKKKVAVQKKELTEREKEQAITNLKRQNLLEWVMENYAKTGIIGELTNAMILHFAMVSRKQEDPVSVICLSASGTGKSYLLEKVADCFPTEDIIENTQMTENSFYYYKREEIKHKIFLIEDMDGASAVEYPIRELISKKRISKTVTLKDNKGNLRTITLTVEGPVTFCGCTTKEKLYEDNANRCILIYLDNTKEQDERIMHYHKNAKAGLINKTEEREIRAQLQNMQRVLKTVRVINPYAPLIHLPQEVFKPRRTLSLLLSFIESITLYHQYQSAKEQDAIVTHPSHIAWGFKLLKESLFRKSDELNATLRNFLEELKALLKKEGKGNFYAQEIRFILRKDPRTVRRYLYELQQYGYIKIAGGNKYRKGYEYELTEYAHKENIKTKIDEQIENIMQKIWQAYHERNKEKSLVGQLDTVGQN